MTANDSKLITIDNETYYRIIDNDINISTSNKTYYINIFGNKIVRKCEKAKNETTYKQLSPQLVDGYLIINIAGCHKKLHILSAKTFINPYIWYKLKSPSVDHIDGDRLNNHWTNLRFMERSVNSGIHHAPPSNRIYLVDNENFVVFNSINDNPLKHSYRYNLATKTLYMKFVNVKTNDITYKLVNGPTRYKFQNSATKQRFSISKNVLHSLMEQIHQEQQHET